MPNTSRRRTRHLHTAWPQTLVARAHELAEGDEIVWRDGTTTTVRAADDDEHTVVWLALANGRSQAVPRRRAFQLVRRADRLVELPTHLADAV